MKVKVKYGGSSVETKAESVLRNRNFALLWFGQTISVAGNGVFTVALPLEVLDVTKSPLALAVVVGSRTAVTVLFLLLGGALVDRLPRRALMIASDAACAVAIGLMAFLIVAGNIAIWQLVVLSLIMGAAFAFFLPASTAVLPDILPAESLVAGNSLSQLSKSLAQFVAGPAAGGIVVAVAGTAWAFGIDAITFVVSVVSLAAMRITARPAPATGDSVLGDVKAGLRYTRSQPWLWWSMVALGIANVVSFVPIVVLEALLVKNVFKGGSLALGTLYASNGLGRSLAAGYVKRRGAPRRRLLAMWLAWSAEGVFALLLGLSPTVWTAAICVGAVGVCGSYGNVIWFPTMQERIPRDLLGRVSSLDWLLSLALAPLGTVLGGALAGVAGVRLTLVVGGALAMCTGGVLFVPGVRDPDRHAVGLGETR